MTDLPKRPRPAVPIVPGAQIVCQHCPRSIRAIGAKKDVWQSNDDGAYRTTCFTNNDGRIYTHKPMPKVA